MIDPADLRDVFDRVVSLPPPERAAFLSGVCGDNALLRHEVERLLAADQRPGSVFETGSSEDETSPPESAAGEPSMTPGTRLGPYVIIEPLGAGGMGEVYRARDTRLDRTVALKVLPRALMADASARHRFEREARAAAALPHPHVCTVLDVGCQQDTDYLVMEFVEGETLARHLAREKVPITEALRIAIEIGEGLAAAHAAHIVHRDVKPGNVMLRPDGFVKVLDFGLAKLAPMPGGSVGDTTRAFSTRDGLIVGTVAYMSPEQARGREVDARTDLWSLGCVLYEMAAGQAPFSGISSSDVLAAVLQGEPPPLARCEPAAPPELQRIVTKALRKDRDERYQTAQDLVIDLRALREGLLHTGTEHGHAGINLSSGHLRAGSVRQRRLVAGIALLVMGGIATAGLLWRRSRGATDVIDAPALVQRNLTRLTFDAGLQTDPTFSPDGRFIAYASDKAGNFDIWVQPVAGGNAVQVTKSPAADTQPAWSPGGSTIAFRSERDGGGIYLVPELGGPERRIADHGVYPSWSSNGSEVQYLIEGFGNSSFRMRAVAVATGTTREIFPAVALTGWWHWIGAKSDGRISFLERTRNSCRFLTVSDTGVVESDLTALREALPNIFGRQSSIFAETRFQWNPQGTALLLQTRSGDGLRNVWRVQVDPNTLAWTRAERLTTGSGSYLAAAFSADGSRTAFSIHQESEQIWEFALTATGLKSGRPLTESGASVLGADASSDGAMVLFQLLRPGGTPAPKFWVIRHGQPPAEVAGAEGLYAARLSPDASGFAYLKLLGTESSRYQSALAIHSFDGTDRQIAPWGPGFSTPSDWSADGRSILTGGSDLRTWPVDASPTRDQSRVVLVTPEGNLWQGRYSPNGRWLTFVNNQKRSEPHRSIIGVAAADGPPQRTWVPISANRPWVDKPRWSEDGRILYLLANEGRFLDVWQIPFDPDRGAPSGPAVRVSKFDSPSFKISPSASTTEWTVAGRRAFITMTSALGSIWTLDNVDR